MHGWSIARLGDVDTGLAEIRSGLDGYRQIGSEVVQPHFLGKLAEVQLLAGDIGGAEASLAEAVAKAAASQELISQAGLQHVAAGLHRRRDDVATARAALEQGKAIADGLGSPAYGLKIAVEHAALLQTVGEPTPVRQIVEAAPARLPTADETPDRIRAAELLANTV